MTPDDNQDQIDPIVGPIRSAPRAELGAEPYARPSKLLIYPEAQSVWSSATPIVAVAGGVLLLIAGIAAGSAWVVGGSGPEAVAASTTPEGLPAEPPGGAPDPSTPFLGSEHPDGGDASLTDSVRQPPSNPGVELGGLANGEEPRESPPALADDTEVRLWSLGLAPLPDQTSGDADMPTNVLPASELESEPVAASPGDEAMSDRTEDVRAAGSAAEQAADIESVEESSAEVNEPGADDASEVAEGDALADPVDRAAREGAAPRLPEPPRASILPGGRHTCALDGDGRLSCWGANDGGQLGDGTRAPRSRPTSLGLDVRFVQVSVGVSHACGVTRDGEARCWGENHLGQLGDQGDVASTLPVPVAATTTFASVTAGSVHTCGLDQTGAAWCWGGNADGQLGNGMRDDSRTPVVVQGSRA